ncbi:MAG: protocadherin [Planctomycetes bacterium]|nr:protocadherin [Planctomycetota bacterium]
MKKLIRYVLLLGFLAFVPGSESQGRGRGGGGFSRGFSGGAVHSYGGGGGYAARGSTSVFGSHGGSAQVNRGGGSYTTQRGGTVQYRGASAHGTTPGGVSGGRYAGGVKVTTPGGQTVGKVGRGGAAVGPGGNAVAGRSGATFGSGPGGSFATRYQGGVAIGPHGAAVGGTRVGAVHGASGTVVGGTRTGASVGHYGAVAGRTTVATTNRGTYYRSTTAIRTQGAYVRHGVAAYPCFRAGWYAQYPGAWLAAGWTANAVWRAATWSACASYGYPAQPVYYDYGTNVVYQDDGVYVDGQKAATPQQYAQQATKLADSGKAAKVTKEEEWLPLGVFAMVQGEETTSNHIFQLSVNKQGVIRGNYYDAVTDTTAQVYGSADKKTQRAAWTVGDRKTPVYEAGLANLTKDATTMLVHYSPERSQQFSLVRVEEPKEDKK